MLELNNFKPLRDGVLVKRLDGDDVTSGGIIIPDTAKEKPQSGIVVAVGEGARDNNGNLVSMDVQIGDKVVFTKWGGNEIKIDGEEYLLMKQTDILGIDYSKSGVSGGAASKCHSCPAG